MNRPIDLDKFNEQLRGALRREPAPPDFAGKVLASARRSRVLPSSVWRSRAPLWRRPLTLALAAGILMAAVMPPAIYEHRRRERERALEAKAQLAIAMSITQSQLRRVSAKLQRNTRRPL
jgi:hypothetical protein